MFCTKKIIEAYRFKLLLYTDRKMFNSVDHIFQKLYDTGNKNSVLPSTMAAATTTTTTTIIMRLHIQNLHNGMNSGGRSPNSYCVASLRNRIHLR